MFRNFLAVVVVLPFAPALIAAEKKAENPREVIEKALKAMGGIEKINKYQASSAKTKGTIYVGAGFPFTQEIVAMLPGQFRDTLMVQLKDRKSTVVTVFDGKAGWMSVDGKTTQAKGKMLEEMKEAAYTMRIGRMLLYDKKVKLSSVPDVEVDGEPAVGVCVSEKGHRDVKMYFGKKTGLPVRIDLRVVDLDKDREVSEVRFIKGYMEVQGLKVPKKILIDRDGKKLMEVEVTAAKLLESVSEKTFDRP